MRVYDITISVTDSKSFKVQKSVKITGQSVIEVLSKMQIQLYMFLQTDFEEKLKEQLILHGVVDDDIPF